MRIISNLLKSKNRGLGRFCCKNCRCSGTKESVCFWGEPLEVLVPLRYAPAMEPSYIPPSVYQFRMVLQGISPLIWRRLRIRSDLSLATFHAALQIVFAWSDTHLHAFYIHGFVSAPLH
jgi:Plasmid pRiA4b ORF-3-like protein